MCVCKMYVYVCVVIKNVYFSILFKFFCENVKGDFNLVFDDRCIDSV